MRTLLVASAGGHLLELHRLRPRLLPAAEPVVWVTSAGDQTRALLEGEDVVWLPPVAQRDWAGVLRTLQPARRVIASTGAERVVSTGAAVALAFLPAARAAGVPGHYVESAARTDGPSATGRLLAATRSAQLHAQWPGWARGRWSWAGSVFDGFAAAPRPSPPGPPRRVLVTLGTNPYSFARLVARLAAALPPSTEVVWQLGATPAPPGLPGRVVPMLGHDALVREVRSADAVVCHAGVGTALTALAEGVRPVLVPRRRAHREHVDDHQEQIARALAERDLAVAVDADELGLEHLERAASAGAQEVPAPPVRLGAP